MIRLIHSKIEVELYTCLLSFPLGFIHKNDLSVGVGVGVGFVGLSCNYQSNENR